MTLRVLACRGRAPPVVRRLAEPRLAVMPLSRFTLPGRGLISGDTGAGAEVRNATGGSGVLCCHRFWLAAYRGVAGRTGRRPGPPGSPGLPLAAGERDGQRGPGQDA